jgi:RsiW-degrading membrane proteinase PrsW (M82 family)
MPHALVGLLPDHRVEHARNMGWDRLTNGALLATAAQAGFEAMITADQGIPKEQRLEGRQIALVVLSTNALAVLTEHVERIREAVTACVAGGYIEVRFPRPKLPRRPAPGQGPA